MSDDLLERLGRGCNCGRCKLDLCCCTAMEEAKAEIERLTINGIHTCHDECQRVPCMQRREIEKLREALLDALSHCYNCSGDPHYIEEDELTGDHIWTDCPVCRSARAALGETK